MDSFNKVLSFILGLVVVVVFLAVVTKRINIGGAISSITKQVKKTALSPTPTPTQFKKIQTLIINEKSPTPAINRYTTTQEIPSKQSSYNTKQPTTIPSTGIPFEVVPLLVSSITAGYFLKKSGNR